MTRPRRKSASHGGPGPFNSAPIRSPRSTAFWRPAESVVFAPLRARPLPGTKTIKLSRITSSTYQGELTRTTTPKGPTKKALGSVATGPAQAIAQDHQCQADNKNDGTDRNGSSDTEPGTRAGQGWALTLGN